MAMQGPQQTGASFFDDVLKIDYMGPVREQLNQSTVLLKNLEKRREEFSGKQAFLPLHTGRSFAIGSRGEDAALPGSATSSSARFRQQYSNATFTASYQYGRISITGPVIKASRNNKGAFLKAVDSEMKGMVKDLKNSINRQLFSDGSGLLTKIDDSLATNGGTSVLPVDSTKFLKVGQVVQVIDAGDRSSINTPEGAIESISAGATATIDAGTTTALVDGDLVVLTGTIDKDLWGLDAIVSASEPERGSFGGINRSTAGNEFWQANEVSLTGTAFSLLLMQQAMDEADIAGEGEIGLIVTSHAAKRRYGDSLVSQKRYPPGGEITLDGGFKALEFNGVPVVADKDAHDPEGPDALNGMYFIDTNSLFFIEMNDWEWMDMDGAILARVTDKDVYEATMFRYFNLVSDQPNANTKLLGNETAAFSE